MATLVHPQRETQKRQSETHVLFTMMSHQTMNSVVREKVIGRGHIKHSAETSVLLLFASFADYS